MASEHVEVVGLGVPGIVDPHKGVVRLAGNLGWVNMPVAARLTERLGANVVSKILTNGAPDGQPIASLLPDGHGSARGRLVTAARTRTLALKGNHR